MPTKKPLKKPAPKRTTGAKPAGPKAAKAVRKPATKPARKPAAKAAGKAGSQAAKKPRLLSGGNPQIAKGDGDAPVQAWIAAVPGWKSAAWARLDALVERTVPGVRKAIRWNSPFYGAPDGEGWFLSVHAFDRYLKVAFFRGVSLDPVPPVESKQKEVRYLHIEQDDAIDEARFADWVKQASGLPGVRM
jgi:hypothetical protein